MSDKTVKEAFSDHIENKPDLSDADKAALKTQLQEYLEEMRTGQEQKIQIDTSEDIVDWLKTQQVSVVFSAPRMSKLFSLGVNEEDKLVFGERNFDRVGAITCQDRNNILLATTTQIWRLVNNMPEDQDFKGHDRVYIPQQSFTTGDLGITDIATNSNGGIMFTNSLFSCISTVSTDNNFIPLWKPAFISKITAENRCLLSGVAVESDKPVYVTAASQSDEKLGWQSQRSNGGVVISVTTNEIVAEGLSLPHSPRIYQDTLYVANSGTGYFGSIDVRTGEFQEIAFLPGFIRGVSFVNNYALVTVSRPVNDDELKDLPLSDNLSQQGEEATCGVFGIDLTTGERVFHVTFDQFINDVFSVVTLQNVRSPVTVGLNSPEIARMITIGAPNVKKQNAPSTDTAQ